MVYRVHPTAITRPLGTLAALALMSTAALAASPAARNGGPAPAGGSPNATLAQSPAAKQNTAQATSAAPASEPAAWAVNCTDQIQGKFACEMTQNIVDQKSGGQILLISIKGVSGGGATAMLIRMFHGVYLPTGLSVKIDGGKATAIAFQKSDQLGVYAALPLDDKLIAELKKGKELKFSAQINQGQPLDINGRLNGFGPAYDKISSLH